jgi:hypothetical protein
MQETVYVVQGFTAGKRGALVPMPPMTFKTESQARERAARLGETCQGVIAFAQTADIDAGDYAEPVVLERLGVVPEL